MLWVHVPPTPTHNPHRPDIQLRRRKEDHRVPLTRIPSATCRFPALDWILPIQGAKSRLFARSPPSDLKKLVWVATIFHGSMEINKPTIWALDGMSGMHIHISKHCWIVVYLRSTDIIFLDGISRPTTCIEEFTGLHEIRSKAERLRKTNVVPAVDLPSQYELDMSRTTPTPTAFTGWRDQLGDW